MKKLKIAGKRFLKAAGANAIPVLLAVAVDKWLPDLAYRTEKYIPPKMAPFAAPLFSALILAAQKYQKEHYKEKRRT